MSEILTVTEAAEIKGVSRQAIYTAIETGKLKTTETSVTVIGIRRSELDKFTPNERSVRNAGRPRSNGRKPASRRKERGCTNRNVMPVTL